MTTTRIQQLKDAIATGRVVDEVEKCGFYSDFLIILDLAKATLDRRAADALRAHHYRSKKPKKGVTLQQKLDKAFPGEDHSPPPQNVLDNVALDPPYGPKPRTAAFSGLPHPLAAVLSKVSGAKPTTNPDAY